MMRLRRLPAAMLTMPVVLALGFLSGWLSGSGGENAWYASLAKPAFTPPGWAFPVAWSLLYALMGVSLALMIRARTWGAVALFAVQLALNLAWSPLFFGAHRAGAALGLIAVLDAAVVVTIAVAWRRVRAAAALLLPYLAWLALATALNVEIVRLNG